ncbi:SDR family NAD(P)-dependent oxidoreductase [Methylomicrobium lacus]|uniref:SDR family NAD(P)-dependent oxidoreductase n=1 Tax=Methylomicrobium lacus TaxID=136992 RepID=UPI0035A9119D
MNAIPTPANPTPRWALITGASSGMGYEFSKLFAQDKINAVLVARNETLLREVAEELKRDYGISTVIAALDLSRPDTPEKLYQIVLDQGLTIDYLINNAGIGFFGPFADSDPTANAGMINLNVAALVQLTRLFVPGMIKQGRGRILNVASLTAYQPGGPGAAVYYASKSFVLAFNRGLAVELKGSGVTTTALCPGAMKTAFETKGGFSRTRLYRFLASDPRTNAEAGYRAMKKGQTAAVPGWISKILAFGGEMPPRRFALWVNKMLLTP